jgi:GrpB-like predicted nucleotidyltransferase (UPF0157 family)
MNKDMNDMTEEELGHLFPIEICKYDSKWPKLFQTEKQALLNATVSDNILEIHHIGSTAIPGLNAKPVIDILIILKKDVALEKLKSGMKRAGYAFAPQPRKPAPHMMFMKGYSPTGYTGQAYHVHIRYTGTQDEIVFRDHMLAHPNDAGAYARLKARLAREYRYNRNGYTDAKENFIRKILIKANSE